MEETHNQSSSQGEIDVEFLFFFCLQKLKRAGLFGIDDPDLVGNVINN